MTIKSCFVALALLSGLAGAWAQTTVSVSQTDNTMIPDNDLSGVSETITLGSAIQSITDVQLTLDIAGAANYLPFNGDYYAYLTHGSSQAVLLNRVGVTAANSFGYADTGFAVTFSSSGSDIHNYQSGSYALNGGGQLTGTWAPDARTASPLMVLDTSPRTAFLSSFDGAGAGGDWILFIADTSPLGIGNLQGWTLQVTGNTAVNNTVPDSGNALALLAFAFGLLLLTRSYRQKSHAASR